MNYGLRLGVLQFMGFIEGDQVPIPAAILCTCELGHEVHCLINRDANVEFVRLHLFLYNPLPMLACSLVQNKLKTRS